MELAAPVTTSIALHHFTAWANYEEVSTYPQQHWFKVAPRSADDVHQVESRLVCGVRCPRS